MNPIETHWHQPKSHAIAGKIFDHEYSVSVLGEVQRYFLRLCIVRFSRPYGYILSSVTAIRLMYLR